MCCFEADHSVNKKAVSLRNQSIVGTTIVSTKKSNVDFKLGLQHTLGKNLIKMKLNQVGSKLDDTGKTDDKNLVSKMNV